MKDQTAVMCHNIAKYNREHKPNENHAEIAENLEKARKQWYGVIEENQMKAMRLAAADERRIANGEYVPAVHAHWVAYKRSYIIGYDGIDEYKCSNCGCIRSVRSKYCKDCGALMDGKDDNSET